MTRNTHGASFRSATVLIASAFASMILGSGAALASGDRNIFVSGNSTYSDCGLEGSDYALLLTGDLEGCLSVFVQGFKCKDVEHFDAYFERGREVFVGTLHGKQGRFKTKYTFDGAFANGFCESFDLSLEVGGNCTHHVQGTSGIFRHAQGVLKFIDVITNVTGDPITGEYFAGSGGNNFLYSAHLQLDSHD